MKKLKKFIPLALFLTIFYPQVARAACVGTETGLSGIICKASGLLGVILPFLVSLGLIFFVWGVVQYFIADGEEAKTKGRDRIIYGLIGLAVIVSVWGLVAVLRESFLGEGVDGAPDVTGLVATSTPGSCVLGPNPKLQNLLNYATCIIGSSVVPLLFGLAVVTFAWGAISFFIINAGEEAKRSQGKQFMIWGIIALAVMVSVWGLVNVLTTTFNIDGSFLPQVKVAP